MYDGDISLSVDLKPGDVTATAEKLQGEIEKVFDLTAGKQVSTAFLTLKSNMDKAYQSATQIMSKMSNLEGTQISTTEYKALETELEKIDKKFTELQNKRGQMEESGKVNTKGYYELEKQLEDLSERAENVREKMSEMESAGTSHIAGEETAEYAKLSQQLKSTTDRMTIMVQKAHEMGAIKEVAPTVPLQRFGSVVDYLNKGPLGVLQATLLSLARVGIWTVRSAVSGLMNLVLKLGSTLLGLGVSALQALGSAAVYTGKKILDLSKNIAKLGVKFAVSGMKTVTSTILRLGTALTGVNKLMGKFSSALNKTRGSSDGFNISLKKAVKTLVKYVFGVRSFFFLYRKIRQAIVDGFGNLAQYSGDLNSKVSNLITSFNYLKASLTTAFAPIVNYVSPILTQIIDKMAQATTAVGQFLAALLGQTSFVRAKKVYQDYAKSLEKNSTKANKKVKELKKTIAGFDDVEILKGPDNDNNTDTGADTKNPWEDPNNMFETVNVESKFKDLADKIKEMWKNADFTELGTILGTKLRDALNKIPWDSIKEVLKRIAKSIATFLNGSLEVSGLFDAIGRTLAQVLNSAFEFLNTFAKEFHWDSLGRAIKEGVLGALNNIDWPLIYDTAKNWGTGIGTAFETALDNKEIWTAIFTTITNYITALLYRLDSFIRAVNWDSLATNIGMGLNNAIATFDWNLLGQTLVDLINDVFDFWYNFITTFDFYKFGKHIGETLSKVLKEVDWKRGGASVGSTITALFDALNGFIENTDWEALGKAIVDTVVGFFDSFKWSKVSKFLSNCFTALLTTLTSIIENIKWEEVPDKIIKTWKDFFSGFDWKQIATVVGNLLGAAMTALVTINGALWNKMIEFGKNIIEGGYKGIKDKLLSVATWVKDNIFKPFIDAFKSAFQISSPSKVTESLGKHISQGLFNGVISKVQDIIKKMIDLKDKILGVFNKENWKNVGLNVIEKIYSGISDNSTFRNIKSTCSGIISGIKDKFNDTKWSSVGKNIVRGISDGIEYKWTWLTNKASDLANDVYDAAKQALGIASPSKVFRDKVGKMIPAGMAEGIDNSANSALTAVASLSKALVDKAATDVKVPAIVNGEVVPYSFGNTDTNDTNSTLNKLLDMLEYSQNTSITREDLISIFTDLLQRYMPDFYIGDEQIARHANAGNARLDRRFNPAIG